MCIITLIRGITHHGLALWNYGFRGPLQPCFREVKNRKARLHIESDHRPWRGLLKGINMCHAILVSIEYADKMPLGEPTMRCKFSNKNGIFTNIVVFFIRPDIFPNLEKAVYRVFISCEDQSYLLSILAIYNDPGVRKQNPGIFFIIKYRVPGLGVTPHSESLFRASKAGIRLTNGETGACIVQPFIHR